MRILFLPFILLFLTNANAKTIFINAAATGTNTGTDWTNAYTDLQTALDSSKNFDTIFIAQGVYLPSKTVNGSTNPQLSREFVFHAFTKNLYLFGGFSGSTASPLQRDPQVFQTILSGNIGDTAVSADNASLIFHVENGGRQLLLDGIIFEDAFGRNSTNRLNGGIWIKTAGLRISNCIFRNIESQSVGGNWFERCNMIIENSEFYNNKSIEGSAAYFEETQAIVRNSIFRHNEANSHGGALTFNGNNGIMAGRSVVVNCSFYNNQAFGTQYGGGAIHSFGNLNPVRIINSTFFNNQTNHFAGNSLYSFSANYDIYNSIFWSSDPKGHFANFQGLQVSIQNSIVNNYTGSGNNVLTIYPQFIDTSAFNFALQANSPAVNTGDTASIGALIPLIDLSGLPRFDGTIDMGAFEFSCTPNAAISVSNQTIAVVQVSSNSQYQWIDCATNQPIAGETNASFSPAYSGNFACIITNSCTTVTSNCVQVCIPTQNIVSQNNNSLLLSTNQVDAALAWFDCNANALIPAETSNSFTPSVSGSYASIVTTICGSDTSDCFAFCLPINTEVLVENQTISVVNTQADASHQWIDCTDNSIIQGANSSAFSPTISGSFACIITTTCTADTTACQEVFLASIPRPSLLSISLYPNPTRNLIFIDGSYEIKSVRLFEINGKEVLMNRNNLFEIDLSNFSNGTYLVMIETDNGIHRELIIKE